MRFIVRDEAGIFTVIEHPERPQLACKKARGVLRELVRQGIPWVQLTVCSDEMPEREICYDNSNAQETKCQD